MSEAEARAYQSQLSNELREVGLKLVDIENKKREIRESENKVKLDHLRRHKIILLDMLDLVNDGVIYCSKDDRCETYTYKHDKCDRCRLKEILENDWMNEKQVTFSIEIEDV